MDELATDGMRAQIVELVRLYCGSTAATEPFVPGSSRIPYAGRVYDESEVLNLIEASLDFWLTHGRYSDEFERRLASYIGVRHAFFVNSGSSANLLAFMSLTSPLLGERRVLPGDEVITVAAGFPTTIAPIVQYGATPVFVDVLLETANIDSSLLVGALSGRTKAVMLAHTLGNTFDVAAVVAFCKRHSLWLIEDNCDALGSRYEGRLTGSFGDIATSSFYPPHHITTGEGGAVYTDDPVLAKIALSMRDWGRDCTCRSGEDNRCGRRFSGQFGTLPAGYDHKYVYSEWGYNLKATDLQAAIGCAQLDKLPGFVARRRENFDRLRSALEPIANKLVLPEATPGSEPSWFGFLMIVQDEAISRDRVVQFLEAAGIQTRMLFGGNMLRQPCFDSMGEDGTAYRISGGLSNTDELMNKAFWVGVYPGLSDAMIDYMAEQILAAVR